MQTFCGLTVGVGSPDAHNRLLCERLFENYGVSTRTRGLRKCRQWTFCGQGGRGFNFGDFVRRSFMFGPNFIHLLKYLPILFVKASALQLAVELWVWFIVESTKSFKRLVFMAFLLSVRVSINAESGC